MLYAKLLKFFGLANAVDVLRAEADSALQVFVQAKDRLQSLSIKIEQEVQRSFDEIERHNHLLVLLSLEKAKAEVAIKQLESLLSGNASQQDSKAGEEGQQSAGNDGLPAK